MNVLLCLFAAKKRPGTGTGTGTNTTPPVTTTAGNSKKTRTVGVQHSVMPISLGHGFRTIGGSQDLFDDSQDDDIQLTQNTPPRPAAVGTTFLSTTNTTIVNTTSCLVCGPQQLAGHSGQF